MKVKKSLIIEDSPDAKDLLEDFISRLPFFALPDCAVSAEQALVMLSQHQYDVIFLDIDLPGLSGIELLESFTQKYPVIITTSHVGFALDSYDLDVIDYLVKPFTFPRFMRAVNRAIIPQTQAAESQHELFLKVGRKFQLFKYAQIEYIEADGAYSKVWQNSKFILVNDAISTIQTRLPKQSFIRVHKSYIINVSFLTSYDHRTVWLKEIKIPIGETYRKAFQGILAGEDQT